MAGIQLGGGSTTHHSVWDKNYISEKEIAHVNNVRLGEKVWDWLCDTVCGTHRAEAKEYIRQLDALEGKNSLVDSALKTKLFYRLEALTSSDYTRIKNEEGKVKYQIGYFKGDPKTHKVIASWSRPVLSSYEQGLQTLKAKSIKNRLVQAFEVQIQSQGKPTLRPVPVYMAHRYASSELSPPLHAYIMTGEPGSKYAQLFGEKNDMTRSKVELNNEFMTELSKAKYVTKSSDGTKMKVPFEELILKAVSALKGKEFAFLDGFVEAIKTELKKTGHEDLLTESHRVGLGYVAAKCNGQQGFYNMDPRKGFTHNEDMRYFEQQKGPVKQQPVKLTTLQEITREQRIYQDYLNEKLGLNGLEQQSSGVKMTKEQQQYAQVINQLKRNNGEHVIAKHAQKMELKDKVHAKHMLTEPQKKALKDRSMVAYTALPGNNPFESNCNRTASTYLQAAINREKGLPIDVYQDVKSGTKWALAGNTRRHIHNPLVSQKLDVTKISPQDLDNIEKHHPNIIEKKIIEEINETGKVMKKGDIILGKQQAKDLKAQNSQDTGYEKVRSWVETLSNVRSLFSSKS
ncbi:hypothetical protein [uncultured Shewanella sp.]|uniref:hypothetical protein n=1 Tax=uncultured Shewanella sp. TaxID=173975 RepID=UPI00262229A1|nr:hypothetical protein [uncultured Shewanella sp.]